MKVASVKPEGGTAFYPYNAEIVFSAVSSNGPVQGYYTVREGERGGGSCQEWRVDIAPPPSLGTAGPVIHPSPFPPHHEDCCDCVTSEALACSCRWFCVDSSIQVDGSKPVKANQLSNDQWKFLGGPNTKTTKTIRVCIFAKDGSGNSSTPLCYDFSFVVGQLDRVTYLKLQNPGSSFSSSSSKGTSGKQAWVVKAQLSPSAMPPGTLLPRQEPSWRMPHPTFPRMPNRCYLHCQQFSTVTIYG